VNLNWSLSKESFQMCQFVTLCKVSNLFKSFVHISRSVVAIVRGMAKKQPNFSGEEVEVLLGEQRSIFDFLCQGWRFPKYFPKKFLSKICPEQF